MEAEEVEKPRAGDKWPLPTELPEKLGTPPLAELAEDASRSELDVTESNRGSVGAWNRVSGMSTETWSPGSGLRSEYGSGGNWAEQKGNTVSELP